MYVRKYLTRCHMCHVCTRMFYNCSLEALVFLIAYVCLRRHFLKFPPNALNKHWEKLLQFEPRFLRMCQSPFSVLQDPYFLSDLDYEGDNISFNCNGNGTEMNSLLQSPYSKDFNTAGPTATFGYNGNEPQLNSLQELPCSSDPMSLSQIQCPENQVYPTICTKPSFHFDDFSPTSGKSLGRLTFSFPKFRIFY